MNKMIFITLSLILGLSSAYAQNKILVISDIDDTIKVANSRDPLEFAKLMETKIEYTGMSDLYRGLQTKWGSDVVFAYVTNSPYYIQWSRQRFLKEHNYVPGKVYYSKKLSDPNHKYNSIKGLISQLQPLTLIMIGDNSSEDAAVYLKIKTEFETTIKSHIYIHRIFTDKASLNDTDFFSFITSLDLGKKLILDGFINNAEYRTLKQKSYPLIVKEMASKLPKELLTSIAFPKFMNCENFKWTLKFDLELEPIKQYLNRRCQPGYTP